MAMVLEDSPRFSREQVLDMGQVTCHRCLNSFACGWGCPEDAALLELQVALDAVLEPFAGLSSTLHDRARTARPWTPEFGVPGW